MPYAPRLQDGAEGRSPEPARTGRAARPSTARRQPYVICGEKAGQHLVNLEKPWRRIRAAAKLDDVRLHDLRHSFASVAASGGQSLIVIGKMLGHSSLQRLRATHIWPTTRLKRRARRRQAHCCGMDGERAASLLSYRGRGEHLVSPTYEGVLI